MSVEERSVRSDSPGQRMPPPWERNWSAETQTAEDSLLLMAETIVKWTRSGGFGANELAELLRKLDLFDSTPIRVEGQLSPDGKGPSRTSGWSTCLGAATPGTSTVASATTV